MSTREVLAIAIKLFSIWVLIQVFLMSPSLIVLLNTIENWQGGVIPEWTYAVFVLAFISIGLVISITLYRVSSSVLTTTPAKGDIEVSEQAKRFLLQLGGIYFLITAFVYLPSSISFLWEPNFKQENLQFHYFLKPFGCVFQIFVGAWLVLHPSWWSLLLGKFRGRA